MNKRIKELTITIKKNEDNEYDYNVYSKVDKDTEINIKDALEDGGVCTSNLKNAVEMANNMAMELINNHNKPAGKNTMSECPNCGASPVRTNSSGEIQCENCGFDEANDVD